MISNKKVYPTDHMTLDEVGDFYVEIMNDYYRKSNQPNSIVLLAWDLLFSENVSNSHHAPHDGETNWGRKKPTAPTGYPGWSGRIWLMYAQDPGHWDNQPHESYLHTGTGGYGIYGNSTVNLLLNKFPELYPLSWDFRIFESDHPKVLEELRGKLQEQNLKAVLAGDEPNDHLVHSHQYQYISHFYNRVLKEENNVANVT